MSRTEYLLTNDAVKDLGELEDYVRTYQDEAFVERLEDEFFSAFERLLQEAEQHAVYQFEPPKPVLHEYRSVNVYNFKVFHCVDGERVISYRIRHLLSDFSRGAC
ncbi:MAG: type II toxin-antitoxin system RelE/ParE family toxin [Olsenella sp.]|nr:type II toxin-antitoxin system RelE/ParE family toxin [Olsenella sp.]MCI1667968.1 type II toxin-antitoxin system RelE/ParE family toxin [Olsenella sp.]MCI2123761.1 type II toxin-antitoxin system RelE/ParE family toxin [Olsenella sp.]MCI2127623.1 type II toxin-antitoxin system RelE/ParE family toxin [Olsenella sp.]MCI2160082.1 type II toxin-antitoxin system RelE/ParE family toxin [Olsenella sp.]